MREPTATTELHPLARQVLSSLDSPDGRRYTLAAPHLERTRAALEGLAGSPELRHAVLSLVSVAKVLEELGSRELTKRLLDLAASAATALRAQGESARKVADELGQLVTQTFAAFSDRRVVKTAPRPGARPAPGAISVAAMTALHPRRA